jgi:methyl-accepting chemotaxis protein
MNQSIEKKSDQLVNESIYHIQRYGCFAQTALSLLTIVAVLSVFSYLEATARYGGIFIILIALFTSVFQWWFHLKRKLTLWKVMIIFVFFIVGIQSLVGIYSFSFEGFNDYGLEHIGLVALMFGVIAITAFYNYAPIPLVLGVVAIAFELVYIGLLWTHQGNNPAHTGFLNPNEFSIRMEVYKLAGTTVFALISFFVSKVFGRMVTNIKEYSKQLEEQSETMGTIFQESRSVVETVEQSGLILNETVLEATTQLEEMKSQVLDVQVVFHELFQLVESTNKNIEEMLTMQEEVYEKLQTQASIIEQNAAAYDEMVAQIEGIADLTSEANQYTQNLTNQAEQGAHLIHLVTETNAGINQTSAEVEEMVASISNIAKQTNLLALNASIEAAHAGEAGAGFAVVAEEVRSLAENSSESAKRIIDLIRQMRSKTEDGVTQMSQIQQQFEVIRTASASSAERISEITTATEEQKSGSKELQHSNQTMVEVTTGMNQTTRVLEIQERSVAEYMQVIVERASGAVLSMDDLTAALSQMEENIEKVKSSSEKSHSSIQRLVELLPTDLNEQDQSSIEQSETKALIEKT